MDGMMEDRGFRVFVWSGICWLVACLVAPYSLWLVVNHFNQDASFGKFAVILSVVAAILIVGRLFFADMSFGIDGLIMGGCQIGVLAMVAGLALMLLSHYLDLTYTKSWLRPLSEELSAVMAAIPDPMVSLATVALVIVTLIPAALTVLIMLAWMMFLVGLMFASFLSDFRGPRSER